MKTIEERAKLAMEGYADDVFSAGIYTGYVEGATEQKTIDDAEWLKIKSSWEREAQINHNDEANYRQGFHDAIEKARNEVINKACDWFSNYLMEIGYPDDWMRDSPNMESGKERFRKAMQK